MKKTIYPVIAVLLSILIWTACSTSFDPAPSLSPQGPSDEESAAAVNGEQPIDIAAERPEEEAAPSEEIILDESSPGEEPVDVLDAALEAYQEALAAWDRGDIETALNALDAAYGLLLKVNLPADSPLVNQKDELRLLIAQRLQGLYATRTGVVGANNGTIPLEENKYVQEEIRSFQTRERKDFEEAYRRSGLYRAMILEELRKQGLPEELSWVPIIESGFKVTAYSKARALGLWQFISSTGYRFGLKRDRWVDERMDPLKSTQAALRYLNELHEMFGDWTTALAAYNCGEFRVERVIKAQSINYLDNFWDLYIMLPQETARFVPRFIATLLIINNPADYGFSLPDPEAPIPFETVVVDRPVKLSSLAQSIGLETQVLEKLNPELRYQSTPEGVYMLRVPEGSGLKTTAALQYAPRWIPPEATYAIHYVRSGETVSHIADRYRTSISSIARLNSLRRNYLIRPGQRLKVPVSGSTASAAAAAASAAPQPPPLVKEGDNLVYQIQSGDSLERIAGLFNTSVDRLRSLNALTGDRLVAGKKLVIVSATAADAHQYTVQSGDTPYDIARRFGMELDILLGLNGLSRRSRIFPGQKLWVTAKETDSPLL